MADDVVGTLCGGLVCFGPMGLILLFFLGIIALVVGISYYQMKKRNDGMAKFAQESGLSMSGGGWFSMPSLQGSYRDHNIQMGYFQRSTGSGRSRKTHTYFYTRMLTNSSPQFSLSLSREGFFSWIGKDIGLTHEIQIGDDAFDAKYLINTNDALRAKRVLAPEVKSGINSLFDIFRLGSLSLEAGSLYVQREMTSVSYEDLKMVADALVGLVEAVDKY